MTDRILYYSASTARGCIGSIDANNVTKDLTVIPAGSFANDWTQITALSGNRILFYGASAGRGVVCSIDQNNAIGDVTVYPAGSFANDWTQIISLSGNRILFYSASTGRGVVCSIDQNNVLKQVTVYPAGRFAKDWTQITALSGERILFYSASTGRGSVCSITANNVIAEVTAVPAGGFAKGWTQVAALSGDRIMYYKASDGSGAIGTVTPQNTFAYPRVIPAGGFATDWTEISFLRPPVNPSSPWAILLCQFKDAGTPPSLPRARYEALFTSTGSNKYNMVDFFRDMSHGNLDVSASRVLGWYTLAQKTSDYTGNGGNLQGRRDLINWGRQAALNAGVNLAPFADRIVVVTHPATDLFGGVGLGAVSGDGRDASGVAGVSGMSSLSPSTMGQEMGHVYGLDHGFGGGYEYGDRWDIMSTKGSAHGRCYMAPHPVFTEQDSAGQRIWRIGPGLNAANMWGRGWLERVWQAASEENDTIVDLRPLHRRDLAGHLCARVGKYFFEFRVKERWDADIPEPCVLVHEFSNNRAYLLTATNGNEALREGDEFLRKDPWDPTGYRLQVRVLDIDPVGQTARLSVYLRKSSPFPFDATTDHFGVDDDSGLIIIGGKIVNVPSDSPLYTKVEEVAQQLQHAAITFNGQDHALLHRGSVRAMSSLADLLSRMEAPREPHDVPEAAQIPQSLAQAATPAMETPREPDDVPEAAQIPPALAQAAAPGKG
ncbi:hypothetical protein ABZ235_36300 [Streptomyces canus]|uniref:hypothetical protein n=1 Tax=Streptomyces canus TaxID=58343 RepID=UPI0033AADBD6